jgi:oxygen-independent coproporphyrinogen-3 oxidase
MTAGGLYVHVPFCLKKCAYCDFYSIRKKSAYVRLYLDALRKELHQSVRNLHKFGERFAPRTIYIGGGTPTAIEEREFAELFDIIKSAVDLKNVKEWTTEANPGTITPEKIRIALDAGVNRFSLGVQSLDDRALKFLSRIHTAREALSAYEMLRECGVKNISVDLILAAPAEPARKLRKNLKRIAALRPEHLSAYLLTYEEGTPLAVALNRGKFVSLDVDAELECMDAAAEELAAAGYKRYEISNYARPGYECRHNIAYWESREYLGAGPAAASYIRGTRRTNIPDVLEWAERINARKSAAMCREKLTGRKKAGEVLYLALRMMRGITDAEFRERTGMDLKKTFGSEIERLEKFGAVEYLRGALKLTPAGIPVSNSVFMEFL